MVYRCFRGPFTRAHQHSTEHRPGRLLIRSVEDVLRTRPAAGAPGARRPSCALCAVKLVLG